MWPAGSEVRTPGPRADWTPPVPVPDVREGNPASPWRGPVWSRPRGPVAVSRGRGVTCGKPGVRVVRVPEPAARVRGPNPRIGPRTPAAGFPGAWWSVGGALWCWSAQVVEGAVWVVWAATVSAGSRGAVGRAAVGMPGAGKVVSSACWSFGEGRALYGVGARWPVPSFVEAGCFSVTGSAPGDFRVRMGNWPCGVWCGETRW